MQEEVKCLEPKSNTKTGRIKLHIELRARDSHTSRLRSPRFLPLCSGKIQINTIPSILLEKLDITIDVLGGHLKKSRERVEQCPTMIDRVLRGWWSELVSRTSTPPPLLCTFCDIAHRLRHCMPVETQYIIFSDMCLMQRHGEVDRDSGH